mgnify:CR=1 FL=1
MSDRSPHRTWGSLERIILVLVLMVLLLGQLMLLRDAGLMDHGARLVYWAATMSLLLMWLEPYLEAALRRLT